MSPLGPSGSAAAPALVAGATGNVGSAVVGELLGRGVPVRAVVRRPTDRLGDGVQSVVADLDVPASLGDGLDGVQGAFLLPGFADMAGLVRRLGDAGVQRLVLLSGSSAGDGDPDNAISEYMRRSEAAVRDGGIPWTTLRPNGFMSNALRWRSQLEAGDLVRLPFADVPIAMVDPADIAAVAVAALLEPGHEGSVLRLSGPEPLTPRDGVRILGEVLGRPLRFEAVPDDVARTEMLATTPAPYVDAFFRFYVDGTVDEGQVFDTVQAVTGRPPRSFQEWVRKHADEFPAGREGATRSGG